MTAKIIGFLAATTITWIIFAWGRRSRSVKLDIPQMDVEGEKTPLRYVAETGKLIAKGYLQARLFLISRQPALKLMQ
jgi:hypothetical protein